MSRCVMRVWGSAPSTPPLIPIAVLHLSPPVDWSAISARLRVLERLRSPSLRVAQLPGVAGPGGSAPTSAFERDGHFREMPRIPLTDGLSLTVLSPCLDTQTRSGTQMLPA